jgi:hypothetical protein
LTERRRDRSVDLVMSHVVAVIVFVGSIQVAGSGGAPS